MTVYRRVVASCTGQWLQLGCQHITHSHRIHLNQFGIQFTKLTSEVLSVLLHLTDEVFAGQQSVEACIGRGVDIGRKMFCHVVDGIGQQIFVQIIKSIGNSLTHGVTLQ